MCHNTVLIRSTYSIFPVLPSAIYLFTGKKNIVILMRHLFVRPRTTQFTVFLARPRPLHRRWCNGHTARLNREEVLLSNLT
jgi:hypothetical protein